jgi:hypothetical protein
MGGTPFDRVLHDTEYWYVAVANLVLHKTAGIKTLSD